MTPRAPLGFAVALLLPLAASTARAAIFTAGPDGTFPSLQEAVDAALAAPLEEHEVRVERGFYDENLRLPASDQPLQLTIRGGWNKGFSSFSLDPRLTVVDGGGRDSTLRVGRRERGRLRLENLTLRGGLVVGARPRGGNFDFEAGGSMRLELVVCDFVEGAAIADASSLPPRGGGLSAILSGSAFAHLDRVRFERNRVETRTGFATAAGGGAAFELRELAQLRLEGCEAVDNTGAVAEATSSVSGVGLSILSAGRSQVGVEGLLLQGNRGFEAIGAGAAVVAEGQSVIELHAVAALINGGSRAAQLILQSRGDSRLRAGDAVVADGEAVGIYAYVADRGALQMTGWTVVGHPELGASFVREADAAGSLSIYNSILWHNGVDVELGAGVDAGANRIGADPRFVEEAGSNYNLAVGSPAIDAGENFPPGGLWGTDFVGSRRLQGAKVDQGAYETTAPPPVGGEPPVCRVLSPGGQPAGGLEVPIPAFTNVCACLRDSGLREMRCAFRLAEIELVARLPIRFAPGAPLSVRWAIHPWGDVGGPYAMSAEARVGGGWVPQAWLGPVADKLELDQIVVEPFEVKPDAAGRTPLRTRLAYRRADGEWLKPVLELLLPAPIAPPR